MGTLVTRLSVGQTVEAPICARARWNPTHVQVEPGDRYRFAASGRWKDLTISTDANGYLTDDAPALSRAILHLFESRRRAPAERWFALMAAVGTGGAPFLIGSGREWSNAGGGSGHLLCFANDVSWAYWNNSGALSLTIERLG